MLGDIERNPHWAATKAAYRFFDNPRVTEHGVMAGHFAATAARFKASEGPVLILQDTTEFIYSRESPGKIGYTKTINAGRYKAGQPTTRTLCGVLMHSSLVVTTSGTPLGLSAVKFWTRRKFKGTAALRRLVNQTRAGAFPARSFTWPAVHRWRDRSSSLTRTSPVPLGATASLLEWLRHSARECRLVVVSSAAVYGAHHAGAISEQANTQPMSPYGHHKLIMEQLCRSYTDSFGIRATILRLFSVYGPAPRKQLLWDLCVRLGRGQREVVLGGTGKEARDWIDVRDVVRLLARLARADDAPLKVLNGGSGIPTSVAEIADMVTKAWGGDIAVRFSGLVRAGDPLSLVADVGQLAAIPFSWQIPVQDGITHYVSWFKGQAR